MEPCYFINIMSTKSVEVSDWQLCVDYILYIGHMVRKKKHLVTMVKVEGKKQRPAKN